MQTNSRRTGRPLAGALVCLASALFGGPAEAGVRLEWRPASATVDVTTSIRLELYAVSDTGPETASAVEAILAWDQTVLQFAEFIDDSPYDWLSSSLPNDSNFDGLNLSTDDGDAYYRALARFGSPAVIPSEGLLVASFRFETLVPAATTEIALLDEAGQYTQSAVWAASAAGQNLLTGLGAAGVEVRDCQGSDLDRSLSIDLLDLALLVDCLAGPTDESSAGCPAWPCADLDADGDVDLAEYAKFQNAVGGA